jgi:hypothetical protein
MISELLALFLPEGYAVAYRHKERWSPPPRHVLVRLAPVQLEYGTPRITTRTRPCSPQDEWRGLKWEFLTGLALFASGRLTRTLKRTSETPAKLLYNRPVVFALEEQTSTDVRKRSLIEADSR